MYTLWELHLDKNPNKVAENKCMHRASLDRLDSNKGYTKDNIQWVAYAVQNAKHALTEDEFLFLCIRITEVYANQ